MKKTSVLLSVVVLLISLSLFATPKYKIKQMQGAWWSDLKNPTADFGIQGDQVWRDSDSGFHPCRIEGDILIFELGPEVGPIKNRIISLKGGNMVLESLATKMKTSLTRVEK